MKPKEIQELIDYIAKSGLDEVNIETEQFKISVKRQAKIVEVQTLPVFQPSVIQQPVQPVVQPLLPANTVTQPVSNPPTNPPISETSNYIVIKAPMIGTLYRSSGPDADNFVEVGSEIKKGEVLCIIEAMKLFNEIESEYSGKIVKVLSENATPVEYDQPLFLIDPI